VWDTTNDAHSLAGNGHGPRQRQRPVPDLRRRPPGPWRPRAEHTCHIYRGFKPKGPHPSRCSVSPLLAWNPVPPPPSHSLSNLPSAHSAPLPISQDHPAMPLHSVRPPTQRANPPVPQRLYPTEIPPTQTSACLPDPHTPKPQKTQPSSPRGAGALTHAAPAPSPTRTPPAPRESRARICPHPRRR
jgi:hypothetical protein